MSSFTGPYAPSLAASCVTQKYSLASFGRSRDSLRPLRISERVLIDLSKELRKAAVEMKDEVLGSTKGIFEVDVLNDLNRISMDRCPVAGPVGLINTRE